MKDTFDSRKNIIASYVLFGFLILVFVQCKRSLTEPEPVQPPIENPNPVQEVAIAFPGAEGGGKDVKGGRGGRVIKVTNLNDSGPGSLREAIDQSGARIIVFEVSGNIILKSRLQLKNGDVTIAGQTAPGDGICIQNYELNVAADNVIIRFMRFRMGDLTQNEQDAVWGRYNKNIIIDHCSMSWSVDECASFYANENFTMQWCIISESLNRSLHDKGDHGYGAIWGGTNASFHHNLLAHHNSRNPRFDGGSRTGTGKSPFGTDRVDFKNNVIYNWGANSAYGGENGSYNIVGNYYKAGPGTSSSKRKRIMEISMEKDVVNYPPGYGKFFVTENFVYGNSVVTNDNWNGGVDRGSGLSAGDYSNARLNEAVEISPVTQQTAEKAFDAVLKYAGASLVRDPVDARVIEETKNGTATYSGSKTGFKGIIDSQNDVGGWPVLKSKPALKDSDNDGIPDEWEIAHKLNPIKPNNNAHNLSTGYDDLEVYLNNLVKSITDIQSK